MIAAWRTLEVDVCPGGVGTLNIGPPAVNLPGEIGKAVTFELGFKVGMGFSVGLWGGTFQKLDQQRSKCSKW